MKLKFMGIASLFLMMISCSKSPEKIVNEVYDNARQQKFGEIANLILPDSIDPLNEEEVGRFEELIKTAMGYTEYTEAAVDSVTVNPEGTEAKFVVMTKFKDGKSYTEHGTLRKTATDRWRLLASPEVSDTAEVFSVTNPEKHTTELMRNLDYAMSEILSSRGVPQYQVIYADYLDEGIMTKANKKKAFELYENAAGKDYVSAYRRVAWAYYKGAGVEKNPDKSFEWYMKAAEAGDTRSFFSVGWCYYNGSGTARDYEKALEWYQKAADAGSHGAYNDMSVMYDNGEGVEKDLDKAHELLSKAYNLAIEKKADKEALGLYENNLGRDYEHGKGVEKDIKKAIEYYKKSAEHGYASGMGNYADVYYYGKEGTPKDYDKAYYWYKKAADAKDVYARGQLAECYEYGRGTSQNKKMAAEIYWDLYYKEGQTWARDAALRCS